MSPQATNTAAPREWERVTLDRPTDNRFRETLQPDAPSPRDEILSRHDEELEELGQQDTTLLQLTPEPSPSEVICF